MNKIGAKKCGVAGCMVKNARTPHKHVQIVHCYTGWGMEIWGRWRGVGPVGGGLRGSWADVTPTVSDESSEETSSGRD